MSWIGSAISGGVGLVEAISGAVNKDKTTAEAARLEKSRPKIERDPLTDQNLALVKSDLANGMSAKAERAYDNIADREFSSSLSSILKGGGDVNSIGDIYTGNEEGRQKLATMRDSLRLNQIKDVLAQSERADERNYVTPWQVNEFGPWADKTAANSDARMAADKRMWDGITTLATSGMQIGQDIHEQDMYNKQFGGTGEYDKFSKSDYGKSGSDGTYKSYKYARDNGMNYDTYNKEFKKRLSMLKF